MAEIKKEPGSSFFVDFMKEKRADRLDLTWYTRGDSNPRPSVPKTDALIHWATGASEEKYNKFIYYISTNAASEPP